MQMVYAYFQRMAGDINQTEKELFESINKTYELYHYLMLLLIDIKFYAEKKLDIRKNKFLKSKNPAELSENFVNNTLIKLVEENYMLNTFINNNKFSWQNYNDVIASLFEDLEKTNEFTKYLMLKNPSFKDDQDIVTFFYAEVLTNSQNFNQLLEELSLYWNDDLEFVVSNIIASLSKFDEAKGSNNSLQKMYKNSDDIEFTKNLFRKTILRHDEHSEIIQRFLKNWELERVAQLDIILLEMALTELYHMEEVPVKVTLNEYIELSKFYSTEKSSTFINGVLDKIVQEGKSEGKIVKKGKGLIGEQTL
ncbi:MAG TPA: transcription antitermination factor NusB [Bacteroidales bacterium]|nr:transcription antitermination factor NusB [Bacteroidales bacterium]